MDGERKTHMTEEVPLNSGGANIFLNTGKCKDTKINSHDSTFIHVKTEKPDVGLHINTTFSIASSKKIKLLFIINVLFSLVCMVLSCSFTFYYWNELISIRKQLDLMKGNPLSQDTGENTAVSGALIGTTPKNVDNLDPRMEKRIQNDDIQNARKYFVEDLGEDMLLVDSKKKNSTFDNAPIYDFPLMQKELLIVHFIGAVDEINLENDPLIGPWKRDLAVSSKNSEGKIGMVNSNYFTINEGGLYLIYAQVVYLTKSPNCYFVWAHLTDKTPRLLSTCTTGDDSSSRSLKKSQISCSVQTVARLYSGDTVNLAQREPNRTVWLKQGYSYFGFVKLSS